MLGVALLLGICVVSTIGIARALRHMDRKAERAHKTMFAAGRLGPRTVVPVYRIHHDFDGGPAFPQPIAGDAEGMYTSAEKDPSNGGMTLRDWFAGQALERCIGLCMESDGSWDPVNVAACAYDVADAMLTAREEVA